MFTRHRWVNLGPKRKFLCNELSRLRRDFSDRIDRINKINIILLFSLYLPAGRQVLNIPSILSKKWDFLYYELSRLRRDFSDRVDRINTNNKIFFIPACRQAGPEHPARPLPSSGFRIPEFRRIGNSPCGLTWRAGLSLAQTWVKEFVD